MMGSPIQRGEIVHKDKSYPGEHDAIIDQALSDQVQQQLATNRINRATGTEAAQRIRIC